MNASNARASTHPGSTPQDIENTVQQLQDELIACQRLAMLGNLSAMAAHEYNNLMTPLVARSQAALTMDDPEFTRKTLERTLVQSQRAIAVSRHLLDLAHHTTEPPQACSVADAVREAVESSIRPFEKDGIALQINVPEDLHVAARFDLLCQVLLNLLLNARTAMGRGNGQLSIRARADDGFAVIEVSDSGKGISDDQINNVFMPFLKSDPTENPGDWQRVGLGLSVCRIITFHHGAQMSVASNAGLGCTFTVRWPLSS